MTAEELAVLLEKALGALADIGFSEDMSTRPGLARKKAARVYSEIVAAWPDRDTDTKPANPLDE